MYLLMLMPSWDSHSLNRSHPPRASPSWWPGAAVPSARPAWPGPDRPSRLQHPHALRGDGRGQTRCLRSHQKPRKLCGGQHGRLCGQEMVHTLQQRDRRESIFISYQDLFHRWLRWRHIALLAKGSTSTAGLGTYFL